MVGSKLWQKRERSFVQTENCRQTAAGFLPRCRKPKTTQNHDIRRGGEVLRVRAENRSAVNPEYRIEPKASQGKARQGK